LNLYVLLRNLGHRTITLSCLWYYRLSLCTFYWWQRCFR